MKRALITGASEGIGRGLAKRLAAQGYVITAVARNEERLHSLVDELPEGAHSFVVADLSSSVGIQKVADTLTQQKFDLLVNNAGFAVYGDFHDISLKQVHDMVRVNCESVLTLSHAFLQTAVPGDALMNVSSAAAYLPMPITSVYTATKAFVTSLSESLWYEQRKRGVYVVGFCPGTTTTQFHERAGGNNAQVPACISQNVDQVVSLAMRSLRQRRQPVVISGPMWYFTALSRLLPRRCVTLLAGRILEHGMAQ
jgi:short-subunit dehydrogenase